MTSRSTALCAATLALALAGTVALQAQTLNSVEPERQRVYDMVTLRGSGFGSFSNGLSKVTFRSTDGSIEIDARRPYVWRDDFIQIRVPVGEGSDRIPHSELEIVVETTGGASNAIPFQLLVRENPGELHFVQRTNIVNNADVSGFLGDSDDNKARTKDAHVGDANGDGWLDLIDNNSNNDSNNTHTVLHLNDGGSGFGSMNWEPVDSGDGGSFPVFIPNGGDYSDNAIVYDADFVDLNNDELVDWVQCVSGSPNRVRVVMNNRNGVPGSFIEATDDWFGNQNAPGSPDDICHTDVNYDGFIDLAVAYRFSDNIDVIYNDGGTQFGVSRELDGSGSVSFHDTFFIDANDDGWADVIGVNENNDSQLFLNNGNLPNPTFTKDQDFDVQAHTGIAADFNGDGLDDFALGYFATGEVFLNNAGNPGNFAQFSLPDPKAFVYDLEAGDVDLDGDIDLIGSAVTTTGDDAARVWINSGNGTNWTTWSDASDILPGIGNYQRLSGDFIDFDKDGDLDLYQTGGDGSGPFGFGMAANQFWENRMTGLQLGIGGNCPGPATIEINAATANATVAILGSETPGTTVLAGGPCAGLTVDLDAATVITTASVDSNGDLTLTPTIGDAFCDFFIQIVEAGTCQVSNVVPIR